MAKNLKKENPIVVELSSLSALLSNLQYNISNNRETYDLPELQLIHDGIQHAMLVTSMLFHENESLTKRVERLEHDVEMLKGYCYRY